ARSSGGVFRPEPEAVFAPDERTASRAVPLWPYLVAAAALLFLADVALRRVDFDLVLGRNKTPLKMVLAKRWSASKGFGRVGDEAGDPCRAAAGADPTASAVRADVPGGRPHRRGGRRAGPERRPARLGAGSLARDRCCGTGRRAGARAARRLGGPPAVAR